MITMISKVRLYHIFVAQICAASLIGCTTYVPVELIRPERPYLPNVTAQELSCLTDDAYRKLYTREQLLTDYCIKLETIIDTTKP